MADEREDRPYRRMGDTAKCPACGWRMDPEAYRCPKCYIYFCFKCRARVTERESQFQCADQSCPCYGKLLCAACTLMIPEFGDVTRTEYDEVREEVVVPGSPGYTVWVGDNWGLAAFIVPILVCIPLWLIDIPWCLLGFPAIGTFWLVANILTAADSTWFKEKRDHPTIPERIEINVKRIPREVTENKQIAAHRCCIQCNHPIKILR